jgi:hypothetical protein
VPLGPWGKLATADPQLDPRHTLNALFPKLKQTEYNKVYGRLQKELKGELALLNAPDYAATYPDQQELKTRKREILQQLEVFRSLPTDALGKVALQYQVQHVNPYWKQVDKKIAAIQKLPSDQRDQAYAELRVWRDKQDKTVEVNGVKFPSPVRMAWATLDPQTRRERLAYFASKSWGDLTDYEKQLLGKKASGLSSGWQTLLDIYTSQSKDLERQGGRMPKGQKLALAKYVDRYYAPGFLQDFLFAQKPLYQRLETLSVIHDSPHREQWQTLFSYANGYHRYLQSGNYAKNSVLQRWRDYVGSPAFQSWLSSEPGFRKELAAYGPNLLQGLLSGNG